jgi:hypothetical protein
MKIESRLDENRNQSCAGGPRCKQLGMFANEPSTTIPEARSVSTRFNYVVEPSGIYLVHLGMNDIPGHCTWLLDICAWLSVYKGISRLLRSLNALG